MHNNLVVLAAKCGACSRMTSRWQSKSLRQRRNDGVFRFAPACEVRAHPYSVHTMAFLYLL